MEDFEERKAAYLNELREHTYILKDIKVDDGNYEKVMGILINPKDETELAMANIIITFFVDASDLVDDICNYNVKQIPFSENIGISYYINIINELKSGKNVESSIKIDEKEAAKVLYSYLVAFVGDTEDTIEFIADRTGFDLEDEIQLRQLELYLNKANVAFNKKDSFGDIEATDPIEIGRAKIFCDEFHTLCEEGKLVKSMTKNLF